jgi:hypothetical protein
VFRKMNRPRFSPQLTQTRSDRYIAVALRSALYNAEICSGATGLYHLRGYIAPA